MKILFNGFLLWMIFCYSFASRDSEEDEFYSSLKNNENSEENSKNVHRDKRSIQQNDRNKVYESEIKILGHVDNTVRDRFVRSSGDSEYSISETPINDHKSFYDNPTTPKISYDDPSSSTNDEVTVTDLSSVDSSPSDNDDVVTTTAEDSKTSDAGIGTGIEVESEEKLKDEEPDELQTTSQSNVGEITLTSRADISREVLWPSGTYGLPKPKSGCPESSGFLWKTGTRFYDTEDDGNENHNSDEYHLAGGVTEDGITWEFCMKTKDVGLKSWPRGKYCMFKKGSTCPNGLQEGFVHWDDETIDNKNYHDGDLPEGVYTDKTKISFCCSVTGKAESEIVLPTEKPFYLFPYGSTTCQKVGKMRSSLEFVKFDEEDKGGIATSARGFYPYGVQAQEKDHTFYLCYYELQGSEDAPLESEEENSEKRAHSEKLFHEFMKSSEANESEIAKEEVARLRNGKKLPELKTSTYHAIIIATGFVISTVAILVGALLVISYFTKRWSADIKRDRAPSPRRAGKPCKENTNSNVPKPISDDNDSLNPDNDPKNPETDFGETDTEHEELVEDGFLPSDSQLKSGLEFLFLKQQKRKWLPKNNRK
ncbi:uncharacterized protein LOC114520990 isoform X2 [Dendronephthya gigantea]|uniref:uncharacterized protein LOC114520990 isoform X2 n=1 Tax=Dendronephthya gigantea TaxID=151771 RepID=UPI0010691590|nr:uncharacterized protein LOC114520990 isoform X2 [Dendronephthya gigantea]